MSASALAVIADIHGNSWALRAVLADLDRRGIDAVVNLGDCYYGPLDPAGTYQMLRERSWPTVRGNQDRVLLEPASDGGRNATLDFVLTELGEAGLEWLAAKALPPRVYGDLFLCHGTPEHDDVYLLEVAEARGLRVLTPSELDVVVAGVEGAGILCGHSHVPRYVTSASRKWVLNPGSVGLPAYSDEAPFAHAMEAGSPHARYAVIESADAEPVVTMVAVPYDVESAVRAAKERGRPDWAAWLALGRAL
jgi:predicted phosphodiesterase